MRNWLGKAYRTSPRDVVRAVTRRWPAAGLQRARDASPSVPLDEAFLRSDEYSTLMSRYLPYDGSYDLHEAQNETRCFRFRHHELAARLGVFRWRGIQKHLEVILPLVSAAQSRVLDFGGAGGPLGLGSLVVDRLERDALGRPVPYASLPAAGTGYDVAFSSHALEHIPALDEALTLLVASLRPGGHLLLHLPAFSCERWRAGVHRNQRFNDHVWTFGIGPEPAGVRCQSYVDIAGKVAATFDVAVAEYCGDDSIFVHARRR
jgi:hypothetical protein